MIYIPSLSIYKEKKYIELHYNNTFYSCRYTPEDFDTDFTHGFDSFDLNYYLDEDGVQKACIYLLTNGVVDYSKTIKIHLIYNK